VGIAVVNDDRRVLALERYGMGGAWQLPQGGLDDGEEPLEAARRELWEETRLDWSQVELLGEHPEWLAYELPRENRTVRAGRGQVHRWFVVALADRHARIDIGHVDADKGHPEFTAYRWVSFDDLLREAVVFRRPAYERVAQYAATLR
jgi:putative (di)nucleoside polyphosphate hydrolase